jgi:hypothetical protein
MDHLNLRFPWQKTSGIRDTMGRVSKSADARVQNGRESLTVQNPIIDGLLGSRGRSFSSLRSFPGARRTEMSVSREPIGS